MRNYIAYISKFFNNKHVLFFTLWLLVALLFQFHKIISSPPLSIHQGAQTDRASIALNYYQVSMYFFEPRVMETGTKDGITPCEFPLINYSAALFYTMFGYNPFWYRFLMWCLMGIGLWAAFDMLCLWLANKWAALLITFTWYFSAILIFYTPNFLPDTASLAFMLLALRQWFICNYDLPLYKRLAWFTLFAALACLIKITSLLFIITIVAVAIISLLKKAKILKFTGASVIVFMLVFSWYIYCRWLAKEVGGSYFLMSIAVPNSMSQLREWFHIFYANWFTQIYNVPQWILISLGLIVVPFSKEQPFLKHFAIVALTGALCIYFLMAGQFRYHDYYSITLLPVFLFFMVFAFKWLYNLKPYLAYLIISVICVWGLIDAKNNFRLRYTPGEYFYQTFFEPKDFNGVDDWLTKNGLARNQKVLAAFDINPNNLLYFLNRRGYRINDHSAQFVRGKLAEVDGVVTNDTTNFFNKYPETRHQLILKSTLKPWLLYQKK